MTAPSGEAQLRLPRWTKPNGKTQGIREAELSWVEEDNVVMQNTAAKVGATPYRKYRVYEHKL